MPKIRPRALETALGEVYNVFKSNKNVAFNVDVFLRVQTIIVIIVLILLLANLSKMI